MSTSAASADASTSALPLFPLRQSDVELPLLPFTLHRRLTSSSACSRKGKARAIVEEWAPALTSSLMRRTRSTPTRPRPTIKFDRTPRRTRTVGRASSPARLVLFPFDSSEDEELPPPPPPPPGSPIASLKRRPHRSSRVVLPDVCHTDSGYASATEDSCPSSSRSASPQRQEELLAAAARSTPSTDGWTRSHPRLPPGTVSALVLVVCAVLLSLLPRESALRPRPISPAQFWGSIPSASPPWPSWWWSSRSSWINILFTGTLGLPVSRAAALLSLALLPLLRPRFWSIHAMWYALLVVRLTLGFIFCRGTGWQFPRFFWTSAASESAHGLLPFLLTEMVRQWIAGAERKRMLPAVMVIAAASMRDVPWWGGSALLTGAALGAIQAARQRRCGSQRVLKRLACLLVPMLVVFLGPSLQLHRGRAVAAFPAAVSSLKATSPLVTVLLMSAPRPGHPTFLLDTLASYLSGFPSPSSPAGNEFRILVYTHFASHPVFDAAVNSPEVFPGRSDLDAKMAHYVRWVRHAPLGQVDRLDQRLHLARAIAHVVDQESEYVMLAEDDFPLCHEEGKGWGEVMRLVSKTREWMPDLPDSGEPGHCGLFVGTGGSGLVIRRSLARVLPEVLLGKHDETGEERERRALAGELDLGMEEPPDVSIQRCLLGLDGPDACRTCAVPSSSSALAAASARLPWHDPADGYGKTGLAVSERLVMRHLGYNASTVPDRSYKPEEWGCDWRHPFNGHASVLVL